MKFSDDDLVSDIPYSHKPVIVVGLSDRLNLAAGVIIDKHRRGGDSFCLSCHLYTRRLTDLELSDLFDYFVKNGYPGCSIVPNRSGKKFIFLNPH